MASRSTLDKMKTHFYPIGLLCSFNGSLSGSALFADYFSSQVETSHTGRYRWCIGLVMIVFLRSQKSKD